MGGKGDTDAKVAAIGAIALAYLRNRASAPRDMSAGAAIALLILGIYLANGGGITQKVSQNLGLRDGIVRVYNENAATNHVYASITGYWASDRTPADGKYLIITPGK